MKTLFVCSDFHENHYYENYNGKTNKKFFEAEFALQCNNFLPEANYIVVAGDISNKYLGTVYFLEWLSKKYEAVYWVQGNHDYVKDREFCNNQNKHYTNQEYIRKINDEVCKKCKNVFWLDEQPEPLKIPGTSETISGSMGIADFTYGAAKIKKQYSFSFYRNLWYNWYDSYWGISVEEYIQKINDEKQKISKQLDQKPTLFVSHYLPSNNLVDKKYADSYYSGFFTWDGDKDIKKFEKNGGRFWMCGHTHTKFRSKANNVEILCCPKGYPHENNWNIEKSKEFVIELRD